MQILSLPASTGAAWLRDGWRLLKRQPIGLSAMVVVYVFVTLLLPLLIPAPEVGMVVAGVVSPFTTLGLMAAFREVAMGRLPTPAVFAQPLQDRATRSALLRLGFVNAGLMLLIGIVGNVLVGPVSTPAEGGAAGGEVLHTDRVATAMLLWMLLYSPVMVAMWFAPMLAGWNRVSIGKAMFGSAVAFWRNKGAIFIYSLLVMSVMMSVSILVTILIAAFFSPQAAPVAGAPVGLALLTYVQASFYPMYRSIFAEEAVAPATADTPDGPA